MKRTMSVVAVALLISAMAVAGHKDTTLDGTSWNVDVEPDSMAEEKGEKEFKDTLTFVDGKVSLKETKKMGFDTSSYKASKSGEDDWTFSAEQSSNGHGTMVWTGTIHGNDMKGKMVWTKKDSSVLTYTFHGNLNT